MNRLGRITATFEAIDCFEGMLCVFRNCVVLAVDRSMAYMEMMEFQVATNFLPEVKPGDMIPEYSVQLSSKTDEAGNTVIDLVEFISETGEKYIAYP